MADAIPWMVGEAGAIHPASLGRQVAYMASRRGAGVLGPLDLKVTQRVAPGAGVLIGSGIGIIPCNEAGQFSQSYVGPYSVQEDKAIPLTAGAIRSDLVIAQVKDSSLAGAGWAVPVDPSVGPYYFTEVLSGVSPTTTSLANTGVPAHAGYSAIPLARIDQPASNAGIINSQIIDLRKLADPRKDQTLRAVNTPTGPFYLGGATDAANSAVFADWLAVSAGIASIDIPAWATSVAITANIYGVRIDRLSASVAGSTAGQIRVRIGTVAPGPLVTQGANYDLAVHQTVDVTTRTDFGTGDTLAIPTAYRGTTQTVAIQGYKNGGNKRALADAGTFVMLNFEFRETIG